MTVRERFEDFADCLLVGFFVAVTALPVVTAPSGFAAACRVLAAGAPPRLFFREFRERWRSPAGELAGGIVFGGLSLFLGLDAALALTVLPGSWLLRLAVVVVCVAAVALLLAVAARAGVSRIGWRAALQWKAPEPMLMAVLVVAGVLVWTLPPIALVIGGPVAYAAGMIYPAVVDK